MTDDLTKESVSERELQDRDKVNFNYMTPRYGRAMFAFCLEYKNRYLIAVRIAPLQQPEAKETFIINHKCRDLITESWVGLDAPKIWRHLYCADHKSLCFHLYVPNYATHFDINKFSTSIDINFGKD